MDFLTPELFSSLIIANIIVGLALASFRFYRDMTRDVPAAHDHREQQDDEASRNLAEPRSQPDAAEMFEDDNKQSEVSQND